jgi:hypothetical protein
MTPFGLHPDAWGLLVLLGCAGRCAYAMLPERWRWVVFDELLGFPPRWRGGARSDRSPDTEPRRDGDDGLGPDGEPRRDEG